MKNLTYEDVKKHIESFGYELISDEYKNKREKITVQCDKGHRYDVAFSNFEKGRRCPICSGGVRLTYSEVKKYVESFNQKLISTEYTNAKTKLEIECEYGHRYYISFDCFKSKKMRCPSCKGTHKYSYSEVEEYVNEQGYRLVSNEYKRIKEKITLECPKGHLYNVTFYDFKNKNRRCPICQGLERHSYDYIKEYIESFGYILLSEEYINRKTKLEIMCPEGHVYWASFDKFKIGRRCPYCNGNHIYSHEEVKDYLATFGYKLLSDTYVNVISPIKIMCPEGHVYTTIFYNFNKKGTRCYKCTMENLGYSYEYVKGYIESFGYKLLSDTYVNSKEKLLIECDKGHRYEQCFDVFKNAECRCPSCTGTFKYTYDEVDSYISSFGYKLISNEYVNNRGEIEIMCDKGHIYKTNFSNFKNGKTRCPICNESKGERYISSILNKYDIDCIKQKRFSECVYKNPLPFDFYISSLNTCIEYDGEQHFIPFEYFGGDEGLMMTQLRDGIKDSYCEDNGIKLIRIPYWDFDNIEEILIRELNLDK
ncbi:MAG: hypothetical protein ACRC1P_10930 [Cellulosilyticaceae bacterium]